MNQNTLALLVGVLVIVSLGVGYGGGSMVAGVQTVTATTTATTQAANATGGQSSYVLTLVITTNNIYNSTVGDQPAYYVLGPNGLQATDRISLPANTLIKLVIVDYDDGNASLTSPQYANVQGTVNGTITVVSNDNVNSSQGASGISVKGGETVSNISPDMIAHTFTIPSLGINIPVAVSSTVVAYIKISGSGTYLWFCETVCGSGSDGLQGAMDTPAWMMGGVVTT